MSLENILRRYKLALEKSFSPIVMPPRRAKTKEANIPTTPSIRSQLLAANTRQKMSLRSENSPQTAESEQIVVSQSNMADLNSEELTIASLAKMMKENHANVMGMIGSIDNKLGVTSTSLENKLELISSRVDEIGTNCTALNEKISNVEKRVVECEEIVKAAKNDSVMVKYLSETVKSLQTQINNLLTKDEAKEQHSRKMNLWMYGVPENKEGENIWKVFYDFCGEALEFERDVMDMWMITNIHRVGKFQLADRPIIIAFLSWPDRQTLLKAGAKLALINRTNKTKYGIRTDLAPLARHRRWVLNEVAKKMRKPDVLQVKVCDNPKGSVWLRQRKDNGDQWVDVKQINNDHLPPSEKDFKY